VEQVRAVQATSQKVQRAHRVDVQLAPRIVLRESIPIFNQYSAIQYLCIIVLALSCLPPICRQTNRKLPEEKELDAEVQAEEKAQQTRHAIAATRMATEKCTVLFRACPCRNG